MALVIDKSFILDEIRRTAAANGGKPLGSAKFRTETGIRAYDWKGVFWARWSEALIEAGFAPNQFQAAIENDELMRLYAKLTKELGHLPSDAELRLKRRSDPEFPTDKTFRRFGNKRMIVAGVSKYCKGAAGFENIVRWCDEYLSRDDITGKTAVFDQCVQQSSLGCVYLAKSGRYCKIGRSNAAGRREYEIGLKLPEELKMIHVIPTDDPQGIEAYWHKRFEAKRKKGEWFELTREDVSAFQRQKFM